MPLREDLLVPIAGENPSGDNLYYDRIFDQIKEARREEEDDLPEGDWERSQKKKADHYLVVRLAGDALAKRSKDLRLASWFIESQLKIDGLRVLGPGIDLLRTLQESFWETIYPQIEEDDDIELRSLALEAAGRQLAQAIRKVPLTRAGMGLQDYIESRLIGYEADATSDAKQEARKEAIDRGRPCAEDFDRAVAASPKQFYLDVSSDLKDALRAFSELEAFNAQKYGERRPNISKLHEGLEEVDRLVNLLLKDRRRIEPDPEPGKNEPKVETVSVKPGATSMGLLPETRQPVVQRLDTVEQPAELAVSDDPYYMVVRSAQIIFDRNPKSPVAYLLCAGLRLGETRLQGATPDPGFAVGPSLQTRQSMRLLANRGDWAELLRSSLPILADECARGWLDLHRYIWRAATESGGDAIAAAVAGTLRSLLEVRPELRNWTLEDDTGAANPETQQWIDSVVMQQ